MPIIASQHRWKDADHVPLDTWPADCTVQWGSRGVVVGENGSRGTAFFEAFPTQGGFFRGEGADIAAAEASAFAKFARFNTCVEHAWSRGTYLNGGCHCRKCGAFHTAMKPVHILGEWRKPLNSFELEAAVDGGLERQPWHDADSRKHYRKMWLRLRWHGIKLPPIPDEMAPDMEPVTDENGMVDYSPLTPYGQTCRDITCTFLDAQETQMPGKTDGAGLGMLFDGLSMRMVQHVRDEWRAKRAAAADAEEETA